MNDAFKLAVVCFTRISLEIVVFQPDALPIRAIENNIALPAFQFPERLVCIDIIVVANGVKQVFVVAVAGFCPGKYGALV